MKRLGFLALVAVAALTGCDTPDEYTLATDQWHADRVERLRAEDGWLTLVGLHPLRDGANTVGTAPERDVQLDADAPPHVGTVELTANGNRFLPATDRGLTADGEPCTGAVPVVTDAEGKPTIFRIGTVSFHVIDRGGRLFLRVKDSASAVRLDFQGIDRFPVDPAWRITAHLESEGMPPTVPIVDVLGDVEQAPSPGVLVFEIDGHRHRLIPVGEPGKPLFIVFGDASNGHETYGGGRFLSADPPDAEGNVILDFNRATNPPCAFTPHATCPLPPPENRLPVPVTAGEKVWGEHH